MSESALIELIVRCQRGEVAAFGALFDLYHRRVFSVAYAMTADYATASDVVQEVFMKLLTRIRQFRFRSAFDTWLYRIIVNTTNDHRRAPRTAELPETPIEPTQQRELEQRETERAVRHAIAKLPPKLREPIVLRYISGLSYEEIAGVLEISAGTVASRLARAHNALARRLGGLA